MHIPASRSPMEEVMRTPRLVGFAVVSITLAACGGGRRAVEINPQEQQVAQMSLPIIQRHLATLSSLREMA